MDSNKDEKFLPIGSVVLLKGGTKKAMITGFCSVAEEDKTKMYDYTGCVYPEGYLDFNQICLFDHNQIEKIFHYGYEDDEEKEFKQQLNEIASQFENGDENVKLIIDDLSSDEEDNDSSDTESSEDIILPILVDDNPIKSDTDTSVEQLEYL